MKDHGKSLGVVTAAAALALTAGLASGQCQVSTGADVIVGDVQSSGGSYGAIPNPTAVAGVDATSLGTTSCNIGNAQLLWISGNNQHPVIGGTLYQYREFNGGAGLSYANFEQIGQSWLKHGFFALSQNLCCANCAGTNGTRLGIGCSDPYTASRNGDQGGLGPKWQVNASTGAFTYPPANPTWSGSLARRLQFNTADTVVSNTQAFLSGNAVRHFGESQYVTPDDAAAGNKFNNSSYRWVTVSGTSTNFTVSLQTAAPAPGLTAMNRQKAAAEVWPLIDPNVIQDIVIVPNATPIVSDPYKGEGKYIVSSRAYDLGNGTWHYEYSIFNQCSHRSAGFFDVPVPDGVTVTNVGFHDIDYRNGDGEGNVSRSGTDWATDMSGSKVGWATEPYAVNTNANAIRWGTMYSFRFVADTAPQDATATIGLWRPPAVGEPSDFTARVMAPSAPVGNPCLADWDGDDSVDVPDIFAFLSDWFAEDPEAYNFGGTFGTAAIFAFLSEWFAHGTGPC